MIGELNNFTKCELQYYLFLWISAPAPLEALVDSRSYTQDLYVQCCTAFHFIAFVLWEILF